MTTDQQTLFDQRKYRGALPQTYQIVSPTAEQTVLHTLPAYRAYLEGESYSRYTPADFSSDVQKFGLFVRGRPLHAIQTVDIQCWIGTLKRSLTAKTISRKLSALTNYFSWLEGQQVLPVNPTRAIRYTRVTSPLPVSSSKVSASTSSRPLVPTREPIYWSYCCSKLA